MVLFVLYWEELRALARGRFLFFGLAALFAFVGLLGFGAGPNAGGLWPFLFLTYAVIPSSFAAFAAVQIAGPRANKFVQAVFTAPVRRGTYILAKIMVCLTVGVLYLVMTSGFLLVYLFHVGVPGLYADFLLVLAGMILFGTAYGIFLGVVFTGRSVAAPVSLGVLPIFLTLAVPFLIVSMGESNRFLRELYVRLAHLSPHVNLLEGNSTLPGGAQAKHAEVTLWIFLAATVALLGLAVWIYLFHQSVEMWDGADVWKPLLVLLGAALVLAPAIAPAMTYESESQFDPGSHEPGQGYSAQGFLVAEGARLTSDGIRGDGRSDPNLVLTLGKTTSAQLALLFSTPPGRDFMTIQVHAEGDDGLEVTGAKNKLLADIQETELLPGFRPDEQFLVVRVPVRLEPTRAEGLTGVQYDIFVWTNATYTDGRDNEERTEPRTDAGLTTLQVHAEYPDAHLRMLPAWVAPPALLLTFGMVRGIGRR